MDNYQVDAESVLAKLAARNAQLAKEAAFLEASLEAERLKYAAAQAEIDDLEAELDRLKPPEPNDEGPE